MRSQSTSLFMHYATSSQRWESPFCQKRPHCQRPPCYGCNPKIKTVLKVSTLQIWMQGLQCWPQVLCFTCRLHVTSTLTGWALWKSWMMTTSWGRRTLSISLSARRTGRRKMKCSFQLSSVAKVRLIQSSPVNMLRPRICRANHDCTVPHFIQWSLIYHRGYGLHSENPPR